MTPAIEPKEVLVIRVGDHFLGYVKEQSGKYAIPPRRILVNTAKDAFHWSDMHFARNEAQEIKQAFPQARVYLQRFWLMPDGAATVIGEDTRQ